MENVAPKLYPYEVMNHPLAQAARAFALLKHESVNQRRKYTNEPYIVHPEEVALTVARRGGSLEQVCAAWMHDTIEDTGTTKEEVEFLFGTLIAQYVVELTDVSKPADGNRKKRKAIDRAHTAMACAEVKTIKLADILSNIKSIFKHDRAFARVYLTEKSLLLPVLKEGDAELYKEATRLVSEMLSSFK